MAYLFAPLSSGELSARFYGIRPAELQALAYKITRNSSEREDLTQEMSLCLLESLPGQTKSWYKQRCYYRAIDYLRHNNHHPTDKDADILDHTTGESLLEMQRKIDLNEIEAKASQVLSPQEQETFSEYYLKGLTQKEIARKLNLTRACVAKKLKRMCHKITRSYVVHSENLNLSSN